MLALVKELIIHDSQELDNLTENQREIVDARLMIVAHIAELKKSSNTSKAVRTLIQNAKEGSLDIRLQEALFLRFYQKPNGISVEKAYADFMYYSINNNLEYPTIHQVRYALRRMSNIEGGGVTGSARKSMLPYINRDWETLGANAVWVGDGTSMKLKIQHPEHGRPFIPELSNDNRSCQSLYCWLLLFSR